MVMCVRACYIARAKKESVGRSVGQSHHARTPASEQATHNHNTHARTCPMGLAVACILAQSRSLSASSRSGSGPRAAYLACFDGGRVIHVSLHSLAVRQGGGHTSTELAAPD